MNYRKSGKTGRMKKEVWIQKASHRVSNYTRIAFSHILLIEKASHSASFQILKDDTKTVVTENHIYHAITSEQLEIY